MDVIRELPGRTARRLQHVARSADLEILDGRWWFNEFQHGEWPARVRADAVALIRDEDGWSQLVPVAPGDRSAESFRVWRFHFPAGVSNSGFVGWLATRIKHRTGSGVFVVCGQNSGRGGIYDYWGCPAEVADAVLAEVRAVTGTGDTNQRTAGRDDP